MAAPSGRGLVSGKKFRIALALPVGAVMNCADNTGGKNLYVIAVGGVGARLNRLPAACVGDYLLATVKKGKPELRKKVHPAVVIRQRKPWRRRDGVFLYFEDNAGVIVNPKGEMKGSAITGSFPPPRLLESRERERAPPHKSHPLHPSTSTLPPRQLFFYAQALLQRRPLTCGHASRRLHRPLSKVALVRRRATDFLVFCRRGAFAAQTVASGAGRGWDVELVMSASCPVSRVVHF